MRRHGTETTPSTVYGPIAWYDHVMVNGAGNWNRRKRPVRRHHANTTESYVISAVFKVIAATQATNSITLTPSTESHTYSCNTCTIVPERR